MKHLFTSLAACAVLSLTGTAFAAEGIKIASVDLRKIAVESKAGVKATDELKKTKEKLENNLKAKEAELKKFLDSLEAKAKKMTDKEKTAKKKEAQKKYEELQETARNSQNELQTKEDEFTGKILAGVEKVVKEYATKNGFSMFIRKGDLIYTDGKNEVKDLTDDILKLYDAAQQEEAVQKKP